MDAKPSPGCVNCSSLRNRFYPMMARSAILLIITLCLIHGTKAQQTGATVITSDIDHFWQAYDLITATTDSATQHALLQQHYLDKASPGLLAFMERKSYTAESYIEAINTYPKFWASVRANTYKGKDYAKEIDLALTKLKALYPDLRPAEIYFAIGALRSGGTTLNGHVLIGAEIAMADVRTVSDEFPDWLRTGLGGYFATNPIEDLVFLNVHEYVHTQQHGDGGYDLLSQCLYEGVPEFVAEMALGTPSPAGAIAYGHAHDDRIEQRFAKEMFSPHFDGWLYNNAQNEFGTRDLGYYVGYALCEKHYAKAADKSRAIKELIELEFSDPAAIERFVDGTSYFDRPIAELKDAFEKSRPEVVRIREFTNGDRNVDPGSTRITIEFSAPMNKNQRGFDFGPLGEEHVLRIENFQGFAEDGRSMTLDVALVPGKELQVVLTENFRTEEGVPLKPYVIDITTAGP